jgi:hypothetical protein
VTELLTAVFHDERERNNDQSVDKTVISTISHQSAEELVLTLQAAAAAAADSFETAVALAITQSCLLDRQMQIPRHAVHLAHAPSRIVFIHTHTSSPLLLCFQMCVFVCVCFMQHSLHQFCLCTSV